MSQASSLNGEGSSAPIEKVRLDGWHFVLIVVLTVIFSLIIFVVILIFFLPILVDIREFQSDLTQPSTPATNEELLAHFERVTSQTIEIAKYVVLLIGGLGATSGVLGSYLSIKIKTSFKAHVKRLTEEVNGLEQQLKQLDGQLKESLRCADNRTRLLRYTIEARDSDPVVRARAARMIGEVNDVHTISILIERLKTDAAADVRCEAAFGLGRLACNNPTDSDTLDKVIEVLLEGTKDGDKDVRLDALGAFADMSDSNISLPLALEHRLSELIQYDPIEEVRNRAQEVLAQIRANRGNQLKRKSGPGGPV